MRTNKKIVNSMIVKNVILVEILFQISSHVRNRYRLRKPIRAGPLTLCLCKLDKTRLIYQ